MLATVPTNAETRELLRQFDSCDEWYLERVDELPDDLDKMLSSSMARDVWSE